MRSLGLNARGCRVQSIIIEAQTFAPVHARSRRWLAICLSATAFVLGANSADATWEPTLDHLAATCEAARASAESLTAGSIEHSNAWLSYLFCVRNELLRGLRQEEEALLPISTTFLADSPNCEWAKTIDLGGRLESAAAAIGRARAVADLRIEAPRMLRARMASEGLDSREIFAKTLTDLDRMASSLPEGLTQEYAMQLVATRSKLLDLRDGCTGQSGRDGTEFWVVETCAPTEFLVYGADDTVVVSECLPGTRVLQRSRARTLAGEAKLTYEVGGSQFSAQLWPRTQVTIGDFGIRRDRKSPSLILEQGLVVLEAPPDGEISVRVGSEAGAPRCRLSDARVSLRFEAGAGDLTLFVMSGRVTVATPTESKTIERGREVRIRHGSFD